MNCESRILAKKHLLAAALGLLFLFCSGLSLAQITPLGDAYTNSADATTNYGANVLLYVHGATETTYIQFNLASIPSGASVSQATLKLYVNAVTTAGSFNVDYVNGSWSEGTIDYSNAPPLGSTIASNVAITTADKNQYILINVTSAVQAWLNGSETNNGIALVANSTFNASFDSKENTTTSHPPELDIAFAGGDGTITGITTASSSGLTGGGTSGTLDLSLTTACSGGQVLSWNGSAWVCTALSGGGTITGVTAGTALTGGGTSGNVTLNLNTSQVPLLAASNIFTGNNTISVSTTDAIDAYTSGPGKTALVGVQTAGSGGSYGVYAETYDPSGAGVAGLNCWPINLKSPCANVKVGSEIGVYGQSSAGYGVEGVSTAGTPSASAAGVAGINQATGSSAFGFGVLGLAASGFGVYGVATTIWAGVGVEGVGFYAPSESNEYGTNGVTGQGGDGDPSNPTSGAFDGTGGIFGGGNETVFGDGIEADAGSGYAGDFSGDVTITGSLSKSGGSFKIDHPLDPANKYLYHSFVESPDMMNVYNGNATLDANGESVIQMPDWFSVLNRDFRYQLTCIGGFAPVYVAEKLTNNQFKIGGGKPGMEVSWQITGIRQDAWANAHRIPVEEEKDARLKGFYIHPELYGAPAEKQIEWARHPQTRKRMQESQQMMKERARATPSAATLHQNGR